MRQLNNLEFNRIKKLTEYSINVALIEPTLNGLQKSILDATSQVRNYLKSNNVHDYTYQKQGPKNKILIDSFFLLPDKLVSSTASLYRPLTKNGDPRIWFKGLANYSRPNDILGIIEFNRKLYVLNITQIDLILLLRSKNQNPIKELIERGRDYSAIIADELLYKLKMIAKNGLVPAVVQADTAVGRTLESLLGIKINSSKKPDYKGIELKSYREKRNNRKNLFGQVPNWDLSKFKNSEQILNNFGYARGTDFKLYCTVSTLMRNSQGLMLKMDNKLNHLIENSDKPMVGDFILWGLEMLHERLLEKHRETFWIAAESIKTNGQEFFQYKKVEHTKGPITTQFDLLVDQGIITMDHLIKRDRSGKVTEKGPLFKIKANGLNLLFPPSQIHPLIS